MIWIILTHLILFQGMFFTKNLITTKKIGKTVKGKNWEANIAISLFILSYIALFVSLTLQAKSPLFQPLWSNVTTEIAGVGFLLLSLVIAGSSLIEMRESWRVGIKENDEITLISTGIYSMSRNPYFLSYFVQFLGYFLVCSTPLVLVSITLSVLSVHRMVLKEEAFLDAKLGEEYHNYKSRVYRYFGWKARI